MDEITYNLGYMTDKLSILTFALFECNLLRYIRKSHAKAIMRLRYL